ncbi:MAG TPA: hypothetical protein VFN80_03260 [Acidothermaceae bacterium]|nr:hypothetical protein [Acidothermaceae bacterium]
MAWIPYVVMGGASLISGLMGSHASEHAADVQGAASQAAIDEQRREFNITNQNFAPYRAGQLTAFNKMMAMAGLSPPNAPDQGGNNTTPINQLPPGVSGRAGPQYGPAIPIDDPGLPTYKLNQIMRYRNGSPDTRRMLQ